MNSSKRVVLTRIIHVAGKILALLIVLFGVVKPVNQISDITYNLASIFILLLLGGMALLVISFPGVEILRAFRHVAGSSGSDAEIRNAAYFWEAAARSFWILGGLSSVLNMILCFTGMKSLAIGFAPDISDFHILHLSLLSTFYGGLLAAICFVIYWKLLETLRNQSTCYSVRKSQRVSDIQSYFLVRFPHVVIDILNPGIHHYIQSIAR